MKNKQNILGLFAVIESPILVFGEDISILYELWPRQASFNHQGSSVDKRQEIRSQALALVKEWQRSIGDPLLLKSSSNLGAIKLSNGSVVVIGPICPLKITIDNNTTFIENRTALLAANMWLNLMKDSSRSQVHIAKQFEDSFKQQAINDEQSNQVKSTNKTLQTAKLQTTASNTIATLNDLLKPMVFDMSIIEQTANLPCNPYDGSIRNEDFSFNEESFINKLGISTVSTVHNHNQFRNEVLISEAVREGNIAKLRWAYHLPPKGKAGILGFSALRSWQNHAHLQNVLASRAAIDAGIAPEEAYILSDKLYLVVEAIVDPLVAKHMRYIIALSFAQQVKAHKDRLKEQGKLGQEEPVLVQKARYFIKQHLYEKLTLENIASQIDCSVEHLARSFKKYHRKTIMTYITDERLVAAKELLLESNTKIKDIAESLGFCNVSHFCCIFKEREHMSPQQWRKQNAKIIEA